MTGAAKLAALAAQRAGAGLVSIAATKKSWPIYAASMMSVITRAADITGWQKLLMDERLRSVLIGPGAGIKSRTKSAMLMAAKAGVPMVIDADALTMLARDTSLRRTLMPAAKILTPHEGEYARLAKALKLPVDQNKALLARLLANKLKAVVVLKGAATMVSDGKSCCVTHPPAWLATAGTGDVLAGIITALVGQGMALYDAARAGVWLHAAAARSHGPGMVAEDMIAVIPTVLRAMK